MSPEVSPDLPLDVFWVLSLTVLSIPLLSGRDPSVRPKPVNEACRPRAQDPADWGVCPASARTSGGGLAHLYLVHDWSTSRGHPLLPARFARGHIRWVVRLAE